jgi:hypothetical protein
MEKIRTLLMLVGLTALSACGGGIPDGNGNTNPAQPPPTNTVSGAVQFKGAALAGVTVTAWLTNSNTVFGTTTTDAQGNYSFAGLSTSGNANAVYQFWASKPGYGFYPSVGSGGEVIRFDHTGNYLQTGGNASPIYLTVIQFTSVANASLSGANFTAYDGSNPLVSLPATGQRTRYTGGDDASLSKGVAWPSARLTDNGDGTVSDKMTGLIWLKNAGCFTPSVWPTALADVNGLANGTCGLTDGSKAGDWRLPNLNELESLVDISQVNPAIPSGNPFMNVSTTNYWSSTSYFGGEEGSPQAWVIRMSDGRYINDGATNLKASSSNAVWAVKGSGGGAIKLQSTGEYVVFAGGDDGSIQAGVAPTFPRWVDGGNGTVIDTVTGLTWLKQADCIHSDWASSVGAVNALASGQCGLTDGSVAGSWRVPNRSELASLSDRMETNHADFFDTTFLNPDGTIFREAIFSNFMVSQYYWSSSTDAADTSEAWTVFSCDFGIYDTPKSATGYTLAVR